MDPQTAIDAPRFSIVAGSGGTDPVNGPLSVESHYAATAIAGLRARGHGTAPRTMQVDDYGAQTGKAQIIVRDAATGVLCAGSDARCDGSAQGW